MSYYKEDYFQEWQRDKALEEQVELAVAFCYCGRWNREINQDIFIEIQEFLSRNLGLMTSMLVKAGAFYDKKTN